MHYNNNNYYCKLYCYIELHIRIFHYLVQPVQRYFVYTFHFYARLFFGIRSIITEDSLFGEKNIFHVTICKKEYLFSKRSHKRIHSSNRVTSSRLDSRHIFNNVQIIIYINNIIKIELGSSSLNASIKDTQ